MVGVHQSVRAYSTRFLEELRRHNYVTPKNYLDYVRPGPAPLARAGHPHWLVPLAGACVLFALPRSLGWIWRQPARCTAQPAARTP
jgi:hypothetical protein